MLVDGFQGARGCTTDGESTAFVLHQSTSGDYRITQVVPAEHTNATMALAETSTGSTGLTSAAAAIKGREKNYPMPKWK